VFKDRFGDERQGALGADQQMGEDIDGALEIEEGVDAVTGGVLGAILAANAFGERRVALDPRLEFEDAAGECGFAGEEKLLGIGAAVSMAVPEGSRNRSEARVW
jgi:hypothetical protein